MKFLVVWLLFITIIATCGSGCRNFESGDINYDAEGKPVNQHIEKRTYPTTQKRVRFVFNVYALAASLYDPVSGNFSPYAKVGIFTENYDSFPVIAGQAYGAIEEDYSTSWWNWTAFFSGTPDTKTNLIKRTVVYIGTVPGDKEHLTVKTTNGIGLTIDEHGLTIPDAISVELK